MNLSNSLATGLLIICTFALRPQLGIAQVAAPDDDTPDLPALLATYRDWGLPLPPADAKLVAVRAGVSRIDGELREVFEIGFLVWGKNGEPGNILIGTEWKTEPAEWDLLKPADIQPDKIRASQRKIFPYNAAPATAVQLEAMGAHAMAVALFNAGARAYPQLANGNPANRDAVTSQPGNLSPKTVLAYAAWAHWAIALHDPNSDRAVIARRLEELAAVEPALSKDERKSGLLRSLKLTLRPGRSAPGTIDAMIDDLTEVGGDAGFNTFALSGLREDPRYLNLAMRGFEAVPALIGHLTDARLTRAVRTGGNMTIPLYLCVGDLASRIIKGLAGNELSPSWLADRERLTPEHQATAVSWWAGASREREEDYLIAHVYPPAQGRFWHLYELMFRIIAARYATHLPSLYFELAALPDVRIAPNVGLPDASTDLLAGIVAGSALSPDEKITLFLWAAEHPTSWLGDTSRAALERFPREEVERVKATQQKKP